MARSYLTRQEFLLYERIRYLHGVISRHAPNEKRCYYGIRGFILGAVVAGATTLYSIIKGYTEPAAFFGVTTLLFTGKTILDVACPERKLSLATRKELEEIIIIPEYKNLMDKLKVIREQGYQK